MRAFFGLATLGRLRLRALAGAANSSAVWTAYGCRLVAVAKRIPLSAIAADLSVTFAPIAVSAALAKRHISECPEFGSTEAHVSQEHKYSAGGDSIGKRIDQTSIDPFFPMLTNQPSVCCQPEPLFKCDHLAAPSLSISLARFSTVQTKRAA